MMEKTMLERVKISMGYTDADELIEAKISSTAHAIIAMLERGGAVFDKTDDYANISDYAITIIAIGVNDLLFNRAGEAKLSGAFDMLARQLCSGNGGQNA